MPPLSNGSEAVSVLSSERCSHSFGCRDNALFCREGSLDDCIALLDSAS